VRVSLGGLIEWARSVLNVQNSLDRADDRELASGWLDKYSFTPEVLLRMVESISEFIKETDPFQI
jgi:hypothetical protein